MEFLKRVVPPVLSGDLVLDAREKIPGNSPRLLKVRRLSSAASERTVGDPGGNKLCGNHDDRCLHQQTVSATIEASLRQTRRCTSGISALRKLKQETCEFETCEVAHQDAAFN